MADNAALRQFALPFPHTPSLEAATFMPHPGAALAMEFLAAPATWPQCRLAIWGQSGTGKTHLLRVWAAEHGAAVVDGAHLHEPFWPESPVAVDDVDHVPSEPALLHLLNAAAEARRPVLLTSRRPPARLGFRLPDLLSRLRAVTAVEVGPADDGFLPALFARLLAERQLLVDPALQAWIVLRLPRTPEAVREAAARLDYAALAAKKAVSERLAAVALSDLFHTVQETLP